MKTVRDGLIALLISLLVCAAVSWPLARYVASGIPSSALNIEKGNVRAMIPGDHLQMLYHMWLAKDTFLGKTPLFHNVYEFNTGDDAERFEVTPYYLPFSLFFTVGALVGGQAFGWNFTVFLSLWLTYWFSWKLCRRYHSDTWTAAIMAALPLAFPFTWIAALGGSPTGLAMLWVPILLYGCDRWVADKSKAGAAWVGAALYFSEWGDTHVFFFNALICPFWCLIVYVYHYGWRFPRRTDWKGWAGASVFLLLFIVLAGAKALGVHKGLQGTDIAAGRSLQEVSLFSHSMKGLVIASRDGVGRKMYVGVYLIFLLAGALILAARSILRKPKPARGWSLLAILAGIGAVLVLSSGVRNPLGPRAWEMLTKLVPPYGMIRQPDKVFCLLPTLLIVVGAMTLSTIDFLKRNSLSRLCALVLLIPLLLDYRSRLDPTICLLDKEQPAYRAVAEAARAEGEEPRAMVIPLWPGNSHYSSLYQYYVSLYRIRMVNGYRPTPRKTYIEEVFDRFDALNCGYPSDEQLDWLLQRKIRYILLHEDAFPEKVSSFPVDATLSNLLGHPRLELMKHDGAVWSFRVLAAARAAHGPEPALQMPILFPVRYCDWERGELPEEDIGEDQTAIGERYAVARGGSTTTLATKPVRIAGNQPLEWHVRMRGTGAAELRMHVDTNTFSRAFSNDTQEWTWHRFAVPEHGANGSASLDVQGLKGGLDLDAALLTRTGWVPFAQGEPLTIPAVCFFRAGYTLDDFSGIALRKKYDRDDVIVYSRHLYIPRGRYRVSMTFNSAAVPGTVLGQMSMRSPSSALPEASVPVLAGESTQLDYTHPDNRFFRFGFRYAREADMTISAVTLTPLQE